MDISLTFSFSDRFHPKYPNRTLWLIFESVCPSYWERSNNDRPIVKMSVVVDYCLCSQNMCCVLQHIKPVIFGLWSFLDSWMVVSDRERVWSRINAVTPHSAAYVTPQGKKDWANDEILRIENTIVHSGLFSNRHSGGHPRLFFPGDYSGKRTARKRLGR